MKDLTKDIEEAGFKNVEAMCNTYTAIIPEKRLRVFITVTDKEIHYSGSFTSKYKKPKKPVELFRKIYEMEISRKNTPPDYIPYDEIVYTTDGPVYMFFNGKLIIAKKGETKTIIIIDGEEYEINENPELFLALISSEGENALTKIREILLLL